MEKMSRHRSLKKIDKNAEIACRFLLGIILLGLPLGIMAYDRNVWPTQIPPGAKIFTLTGNANAGWIKGEVHAYEMISRKGRLLQTRKPVIAVNKGDLVVLRLRSSDVTHGFSLKAFGIYLAGGIKPGKTVFVSFKADKTGSFLFSCNTFCGSIHPQMQGILLVRA